MLQRRFRFLSALTSLALLAACDDTSMPDNAQTAGSGGNPTGTVGGSGGAAAPKGGTGTSTTGGVGTVTGGTGTGAGGNRPTGGTNAGGGTSTGGTNTGTTGGAAVIGGGTGTGGTVSGGGVPNAGGGGAAGGTPTLDQNGKPNAKPGDMTGKAQDYLRLGEVRILNNNWGSEDLGCGSGASTMSVFVNADKSFGWDFNRGDCDTQASNAKPDFPQLEFGIHPFGIGDERVTSPEFSSTTLLPIQIKDVKSASVAVQNLTATFQRETSWNITFEFWISQRNPVTDPDPGVYAELMTFWGWQNGRWPEPPGGMGPQGTGAGNEVQSGGKTYKLWVQDDNWASGQWRYFQFRANDGPQKQFNGTLDVKPFIDYLVTQRQYSPDFWITRLEVGSEIDDNTQGKVQMSGVTFEINGQSRSAVYGN